MKQKIFSVWEMLLICIILAACQIQPAILSETVNEDEALGVELKLSKEQYQLGDEVSYQIINHGKEPVQVILAPSLEYQTSEGWQEVLPTDVGFCGTPDQIETEFSGTVPLEWYQNLESGQYRLSFTQKTEKGEEKITATFQLK